MRVFKHIKHISGKSKSNRLQTYIAPPGYIKFGVLMICTVMTALCFINVIGAEQQHTDNATCDDITKDKIIGISDGIPGSIREYFPKILIHLLNLSAKYLILHICITP